jgi:hypothetical protein
MLEIKENMGQCKSALRTLHIGFRKAKLKKTWDSASLSVAGNYELRYRTLRQISRKQHLLCQHRPSGLMSKG